MALQTDQVRQDPDGLKLRLPIYPPPCMLGCPDHVGGTELSPGAPQKFPCSKLKLDSLFLQWLAMPESQKLVRLPCLGGEQWSERWQQLPWRLFAQGRAAGGSQSSLGRGGGQSRGMKTPIAVLHGIFNSLSWSLPLPQCVEAVPCRPWSCPVSLSALSPYTCQLAAAPRPRCAAVPQQLTLYVLGLHTSSSSCWL